MIAEPPIRVGAVHSALMLVDDVNSSVTVVGGSGGPSSSRKSIVAVCTVNPDAVPPTMMVLLPSAVVSFTGFTVRGVVVVALRLRAGMVSVAGELADRV